MGNRTTSKPEHEVSPKPISEDLGAGEGVGIDDFVPPEWTILLEDITPAAQELRPDVAIRGEQAEPRIRVYAGKNLIGFAPVRESAEIRSVMERGATGLLGRVASVDLSAGRVVVKLGLEGR